MDISEKNRSNWNLTPCIIGPTVTDSISTINSFLSRNDFGVYDQFYFTTGSIPDNSRENLEFVAPDGQILEIYFSLVALQCDFGQVTVYKNYSDPGVDICSDSNQMGQYLRVSDPSELIFSMAAPGRHFRHLRHPLENLAVSPLLFSFWEKSYF